MRSSSTSAWRRSPDRLSCTGRGREHDGSRRQRAVGLHVEGKLFFRSRRLRRGGKISCPRGDDAQRRHLSTSLINDQNIMMRIGPINSCIPHGQLLSERTEFLGHRVLIHRCSQHDPLMVDPAQERCQGSTIFFNRSSREEKKGFPRRFQCSKSRSCCDPQLEGLLLV